MAKTKAKQIKRNAKRLPKHMRDIAASKWSKGEQRAFDSRKLGTFGAASEVRRIDPSEYDASAPIRTEVRGC